MRGISIDESFTIFRNWLALGVTVPPGSARTQDIKASEIQKNKKKERIEKTNFYKFYCYKILNIIAMNIEYTFSL